jgi:hypothetical protein
MTAVHYAEAARGNRPWCGHRGWRDPLVTSDHAEVTCALCRKFLRLDGEVTWARRGPYRAKEKQ